MATGILESPLKTSSRILLRDDPSRFVGRMTLDEFCAFTETAPEKYELWKGEVIQMPTGSLEHNRIISNVHFAFRKSIEAVTIDASVFTSDQKVYIDDKTYLLPDVTIVCEPAQSDDKDALQNPIVIVEVLSPSTMADDLGRKFELYRTIPSLQHYVLIDQYRIAITHYAKLAGNLWAIVGEHSSLAEALKIAIGDDEIVIPLSTIYYRIPFD